MSRFRPCLLVTLVVAVTFAAVPGLASAQSGDADIVVLKDGSDAKSIAGQHSQRFGFGVVHVYRFAMRGYSAVLSPQQREQVRRERAVLFVDDADEAETPPARPTAKRPPQQDQVVPFGVDRLDADLSSARSGDGKGKVDVDVAVIDSGIQPNHPDLRVAGGINCLPGYKQSDWDDIDTLIGHGTFIAGIVGAQDNKIGVVGYAPGARMWAVRAFDADGFGSSADVICGMDWVAGTRLDKDPGNDIEVANMSFSGRVESDERCGRTAGDAEHYALCGLVQSGVVPVASAGNENEDFVLDGPATYSEVLTATAMGDRDGQPGGLGGQFVCEPEQFDDRFAFFTDFATQAADAAHTIAAPGVCVSSTFPGSQYAVNSGTSFSAPVVAGTVGLCIASGPCAGKTAPAVIREILDDAAAYNRRHPKYGYIGDPFRPQPGRYFGWLIRTGLY